MGIGMITAASVITLGVAIILTRRRRRRTDNIHKDNAESFDSMKDVDGSNAQEGESTKRWLPDDFKESDDEDTEAGSILSEATTTASTGVHLYGIGRGVEVEYQEQ